MRRFDYFAPATLDEAVALLGRYNGRASLMAGGTDLLVEIKENIRHPDFVIDLKKIPNLDYLTFDSAAGLKIGALATVRMVETAPEVIQKYAGLARAARELGSIQVRHRATVAGNICRASPSADTPPPLIADRATVKLYSARGRRELPLEDFFTGPGQTVLAKDEILEEIAAPVPPPHTGKVYLKLGRRKAMELATVGVAVSLTLKGQVCRQIRIVLAAVAPTPIRACRAEELLRGEVVTEKTISAAARTAMAEARPISDVRSSADYRREMVGVLVTRAIRQAMDSAGAAG